MIAPALEPPLHNKNEGGEECVEVFHSFRDDRIPIRSEARAVIVNGESWSILSGPGGDERGATHVCTWVALRSVP
jgi:hypothetical protein